MPASSQINCINQVPVQCSNKYNIKQYWRLKLPTLNTSTYRETRTVAVYNLKWHTDQHCSRQRGTITSHLPPERTDFGPAVAALQTPLMPLCPSQLHYGIHYTMFASNKTLF